MGNSNFQSACAINLNLTKPIKIQRACVGTLFKISLNKLEYFSVKDGSFGAFFIQVAWITFLSNTKNVWYNLL